MTLLAAAPAAAGAALAPEVYSAHVDMHQRLLVGLQAKAHVIKCFLSSTEDMARCFKSTHVSSSATWPIEVRAVVLLL